jgi:broad specificity phosphatase PhoE
MIGHMPGTNLTRDEAQQRARLLEVASYDVALDLTTSETTFESTTTLRFGCSEPGAESFAEIVARVDRARAKLEERAGRRIVVVSHFNFLHFFLGVVLFGDAFGPEHLLPLHQAGHANTGISIFEKRTRVLDGFDLSGWGLTTWNDQAHL